MLIFNKTKLANSKNGGGNLKNKNAFTLIELLAIIVILAIIAVITVPIILNIIENSRRGAAKDSAYGYKDAINKWYVSKLSENPNYNIPDGQHKVGELGEQVEGKVPGNNSWYKVTKNEVIEACLQFDEYKVEIKEGKVNDPEKGQCEAQDQETFVYYTYDVNATPVKIYGNDYTQITEKLPEPDPSWTVYVKESSKMITAAYGLQATIDGETSIAEMYFTQSECENVLNGATPEQIESMKASCIEYQVGDYEFCGVENGTTFCLKPNEYEKNVDILTDVFSSCEIKDEKDSNNNSVKQVTCQGTTVGIMYGYFEEYSLGELSIVDQNERHGCITEGIPICR